MIYQSQDTSLDAFRKFHDGYFLSQEGRVYAFIQEATRNGMDVTDEEISKALHIKLSAVCGRRNSLAKQGVIVKSQRRRNPTSGLNNWAWKVKK